MATTAKRTTPRNKGGNVPAAAKAPVEKTPEEIAAEKAEQEWADLVERATEGDSPASRQIKRALRLEREISTLRKNVNDNRDYLRLMDRNEELTEDQAEFLDTFYPEKEKGSTRDAAEIEATRRAREFARKDGAGE
jgi:hypothetical protein